MNIVYGIVTFAVFAAVTVEAKSYRRQLPQIDDEMREDNIEEEKREYETTPSWRDWTEPSWNTDKRESWGDDTPGKKREIELNSLTRTEVFAYFRNADADRDKVLDKDEFGQLLTDINGGKRPSQEEIDSVFKEVDTDGDGKITYEEMKNAFLVNGKQ